MNIYSVMQSHKVKGSLRAYHQRNCNIIAFIATINCDSVVGESWLAENCLAEAHDNSRTQKKGNACRW